MNETQNKPMRANFVVRIAFVCIFIFLFISVINLQIQMNDLRTQVEDKVLELQQLQDDIDEMELRLNEPINDAFIERVARELGWRRPNEIIFINGIPG